MADDIAAGQPQLAIAKKVHRFVAERGICSKSAEYAYDEKGSGFP